ncbi:RNA methyltransferase [Bordetella pseudohinzii]|uniref:Ribosomal RNA large subunit methyltransferase N n=1 Tax=Bordetella pseudohinzii TaxID=1331258 RepID=A0A0J6C4U7_9BORD|nr:RNA methyltransferase [Bordetella pseudohinzii]ANY15222.1 rRNA methyltransferase [Bordetella pseudohinzii]KMM24292.1 ribosomal RNA large subunit methyltransferase N [Bordetella pseudohinzii]KXA77776.1 rRNA methyltransferase [Bordetella pseudohinzii]KXA79494.1 rRNA methyltransferase [Bordetella pseudohinzii]CUI50093.1 Ribosomal RNA large subunit methyltransferase N [Bordetella pseudohinzii]
MRFSDFDQRLAACGALPVHRGRLVRAWLQGQALDAGTRRQSSEHFLPLAVRGAMPALTAELAGLARVRSEHAGSDGSRLLVELADGQMVESVLLPRGGLCVSTQVGCAVGCRFCMTGKSGLIRQITSMEILAQVVLARRLRAVKKVVFMGMGEPAHNLDNVLEAIDLLGAEGNIGHKNLVFSTVGDPRVFEALPRQRIKPALALSLHTTKAALREQLLPRAPKLAPQALVELGERYARATDYPIQYQWTLLKGVNDGDDELDAIVPLLKGKYGVLNLIPFNSLEGDDYQRPDAERIREIVRQLHRRGVLAKVRNSAGQDVDGGCGQLRARAVGAARTVELRRRPAARPQAV